MTTSIAADPRSWRADTIDSPREWYVSLSPRSIAALYDAGSCRDRSRPLTGLRASTELTAACTEDIGQVLQALEEGRGFAIIQIGQSGTYSSEALTAMYWLIGELLGTPIEQNVQGTLLYDVRDTGQDVRYGARFSVTNAESSFHTDNSFGNEVLDYVGLLCLNTAKSGGESQIVSGIRVLNEIRAKHPDAWDILRQPFHVHRRGGLRPGDGPTIRFPVHSGDDANPVIRYLRYWIEAGHEKAQQPLTDQQVESLDCLDRVASDPSLRVEFVLRPGEMLFVNNRWILHNRTAFEDYPEPERRRHYVRLWVRRTG